MSKLSQVLRRVRTRDDRLKLYGLLLAAVVRDNGGSLRIPERAVLGVAEDATHGVNEMFEVGLTGAGDVMVKFKEPHGPRFIVSPS